MVNPPAKILAFIINFNLILQPHRYYNIMQEVMIMTTLGDRIKSLRIERGLSIAEASLRLGINKGSLSRYENDIVEPSLHMAGRMAKLYGVSLDFLAGLE